MEQAWQCKEDYRYNKGISGRGKDYFQPSHFGRLQKLLAYYPQLSDWAPELLNGSP
jgi:hypothetical protein